MTGPLCQRSAFGNVRVAFKFEAVAVRVDDLEHPHVVTDEGLGGGQVTTAEFVVQR